MARSSFCFLVLTAVLMSLVSWYPVVAGDIGQPYSLETPRVPRERMAGWHRCIIACDETVPHTALATYTRGPGWPQLDFLAKVIPHVSGPDDETSPLPVTSLEVNDYAGVVTSTFKAGEIEVKVEALPLPVGREAEDRRGVALYRIDTSPAAPVGLSVGTGQRLVMLTGPSPEFRSPEQVPFKELPLNLEQPVAMAAGSENLYLALSTTGQLSSVSDPGSASGTLAVRFPSGSGQLLLAFGESGDIATELAGLDADQLETELTDWYNQLLSNRIETPEPLLDRAFTSALYNLEYNWVTPYGWVECFHHWIALWHLQATGGADWVGQTDRAKLVNEYHAENLFENGAVPQFYPNGGVHRDFGGSDQFWSWQVRHHWRQTGDLDFAAKVAPALDRVINHAYEENDPDNNLLLAWGLQIGNQEDFIATPHDGTTPSIEGINMMKTRAEMARGLGDTETATVWEARAAVATRRLKDSLWLPDLGRFAFFRDAQGVARLDGQYHTFIYPTLWDICDDLDSYTTIRHLVDRLMDPEGAVYCSNNFPLHTVGTWGMQPGAAQQPWGAWGLAKAGLRNHTWLPLRAVAGWVADKNHRGGWMEVSNEHPPGYFTPPAGLYLAAVCEALYGLQPQVPEGVLEIAPSFPDHWPEARLELAEFETEYQHKDNHYEYFVKTKQPLAYHFRWKLPPGQVVKVENFGEEVDFTQQPGPGYVTLIVDLPKTQLARLKVDLKPTDHVVQVPGSIAEGAPLELNVTKAEIIGWDDRYGLLEEVRLEGSDRITAVVQTGLLEPYRGYGILGQLNFSRRTLFLRLRNPEGVVWWEPIDLTILPPVEAAPASEIRVTESGPEFDLLLRNNTDQPVEGEGFLSLARTKVSVPVALSLRSEATATVSLPREHLALLAPGDNNATWVGPQGGNVDFKVSCSEPFAPEGVLGQLPAERLRTLDLKPEDFVPHTALVQMRANRMYKHGGFPWHTHGLMAGMESVTQLTHPELPGVEFKFPAMQFIPVSWKHGQPDYRIPLGQKLYKKFYLLVLALVDNHEMFSPIARVSVRGAHDVLASETVHFPGQADWWDGGTFNSTYKGERPSRLGLLPLLEPAAADWQEGKPYPYPQAEYWSRNRVIKSIHTVAVVLEVDLRRAEKCSQLVLETIGNDAGLGLLSVVAEEGRGYLPLNGTPWAPPAGYSEPQSVFDFSETADLEGWTFDGPAFSPKPALRVFNEGSLNSLHAAGESGTGTALSPAFQVPEGQRLVLVMHGGRSHELEDGSESLAIRLLRASNGEEVAKATPLGSHVLSTIYLNLDDAAGEEVQLELVDRNEADSYAWVGLQAARFEAGDNSGCW